MIIEQGVTPWFKIVCPPGTPWQCGYLLWSARVNGRIEWGAVGFDMKNKKRLTDYKCIAAI